MRRFLSVAAVHVLVAAILTATCYCQWVTNPCGSSGECYVTVAFGSDRAIRLLQAVMVNSIAMQQLSIAIYNSLL